MFKKKFRIYLFLFIPFLLNSCSIAGSWVYERIDSYLADYFIEFADFNQIQKQEINKTSKEFHDWFSESELPKIKGLLLELKNIDPNNPKRVFYDFCPKFAIFSGIPDLCLSHQIY